MSILVIDDEHDTRVSIRQALEGEGYFVMSAADGRSALDLLEHVSLPSLILLDLRMPIMSGAEFLKTVRAHPIYRDVPVIIMTADTTGCPDECFVLRKPFDLGALNRAVIKCSSRAAAS